MDNITHTLTGALLGQMGLKRKSRFAFAALLLGSNAPDIDVFAPLVLPVDGIAFHRGPLHSVWAVPVLAGAISGLLWLANRLWPGGGKAQPFRARTLFVVTMAAVAVHLFMDWLTTYAIAIFAPVSWHWYSADAIFIVDWVYWLIMIAGIAGSWWYARRGKSDPGRPARFAGLILLAYIALNMGESATIEQETAAALARNGIEAELVVAGPPPFAFWDRTIAWRSATLWGSGRYDPADGLLLNAEIRPLDLDDPKLVRAAQGKHHVRSFLSWSRMPIVVQEGGRSYLTDQRFYGPLRSRSVPKKVRDFFGKHSFLVPLD